MLLELFIVFLKLGAFTIGGGVAMIPILNDAMVNDKKWFNQDEMTDIIAISQSLPGVIAINMATYVGFKKKGFLGSLVATIGVILPSFVVIILLAKGVAVIGDNPYVLGALGGLKAAAVGLLIVAVWQVGRSVVTGPAIAALALASFIAIEFCGISVAWVVLVYLIGGVIYALIINRRLRGGSQPADSDETQTAAGTGGDTASINKPADSDETQTAAGTGGDTAPINKPVDSDETGGDI